MTIDLPSSVRTPPPVGNEPLKTGRMAGLISCHICHQLCPASTKDSEPQQSDVLWLQIWPSDSRRCPRCRTRITQRKADSLQRCWSLLLASFVLYLPANLLPITVTTTLGRPPHGDTIMSGVIYFMQTGSWHIALIIFVASIFVPLMKLFILTFLLASLHFGWSGRPRERTSLYRLTQLVGRWSMVDVYVVTILVALVRFGAFANINAGPGAAYFAALVILTMFAAECFDPRFLWDQAEETDG